MMPEQCRAARALLDWSQSQLALAAGVGVSTVKLFEKGGRQPMRQNLEAMRRALEEAGVDFLGDRGVQLRTLN
jgi:transcriptional regulator with XRE-family HTH domain